MENIKYIDITQLPEDLWQDAKNIIALDANGEVIKAEKEDTYSKEEIDELLSNIEVSAEDLKDKIKINSASTDYVVTQPKVSGNNLVITDAMSDKNQFHTFGFDKTYSTTSYGLLNYKTPLFRGTNEYNCPQWDGNAITYIYQLETEVYPTLTIPYTCNGNKYVTHIEIMVYRENVRIKEYSPINDPYFPDYQIVPFTQSEIYKAYGAYGTMNVMVDGVNQMYEDDIKTSLVFHSDVWPGQNVLITVTNFPLEFSYRTAEGTVEGTVETPRFIFSTNNVLYGDVPTENETSNAPERLNDYIRYENDEKAYILTDMNYQNVIKNKDVQINSANTDYNVTQPTVSGDNIVITDVVSDKNQLHTFGFDKTFSKEDWVYRTDFNFEEGGRKIYSCPDWNASDNTLTMSVNSESYGQFQFAFYDSNMSATLMDITISEGSITLSKNAEKPNPGGLFAGNYSNILKVSVDGAYISYFPNVFTAGSVSKTFGDNSKIVFTLGKVGSPGVSIPPGISTTGEQNILQAPETVTAQTSDYPERLNDYIRYSNDVKSYILTDKNYQNVIKEWVGTQEEYDELETIDNNTTYYITE